MDQRRIQRGGSLFKGRRIHKQEKQRSIELGKECLKGKVIGGSRSMYFIYIKELIKKIKVKTKRLKRDSDFLLSSGDILDSVQGFGCEIAFAN